MIELINEVIRLREIEKQYENLLYNQKLFHRNTMLVQIYEKELKKRGVDLNKIWRENETLW